MFEKEDGVVVFDAGEQQPLGVSGRRRRHDHQPGHVEKPAFHGLGMVGTATKAAAAGRAHDDRRFELAVEHVVHLGRVVDQLVVALAQEVGEHDLGHRPHADHGRAHGCPDDGGLRERRVAHTLCAVLGEEAAGDAEVAAHFADVFAQQKDAGIACHGRVECLGQRLNKGARADGWLRHDVTSQPT